MTRSAFGVQDYRISKADGGDEEKAARKARKVNPAGIVGGAAAGNGRRAGGVLKPVRAQDADRIKNRRAITPIPLSPLRIVQAHNAERLRRLK